MKITIFAISLLLFLSCRSDEAVKEEEWKKNVEQSVAYWNGRKMDVPALPIIDSNFTYPAFDKAYPGHYKMVTFIDGDCGLCIDYLKQCKRIVDYTNQKHLNCSFLFYIQTTFPKNFQKKIYSQLQMPVPWIWDSAGQFVKKNNLWDIRYHSALLDDKDAVILIGSIDGRPQLEDLYKTTIAKVAK